MADSLYYITPEGEKIPYDLLPDSLKAKVDSIISIVDNQPAVVKKESDPGYTPVIVVMSIVIAAAAYGVKRAWKEKGTVLLGGGRSRQEYAANDRSQAMQDQLRRDYYVYEGRDMEITDEQYEKILQKRSPYYRRLSLELKERFLKRTKAFLNEKTFLVKTDEPFVDMPVLLSASAVQLAFGLDKYLLSHFQYIRIFPEEYFASDESLRVLAGHVYGNTITISWEHFLKGFEDPSDGVNLGLHEMAHALYYQLCETGAGMGRSKKFISKFNEVMAESTEVYEQRQQNRSDLFSTNAYRNLQEFWAETVELFFERPSDLKRMHADLYEAIKDILQQDPIDALYPVHSE